MVYSAYDPRLERQIAIKLLHPERPAGPSAHARLLREARALAQLSHPNVVQVYDVGLLREQVFIAMELVRGVTLRRKLAGSASWRTVVASYLEAARGLAAAHAAGLVHRDFKPDNILVGDDGRVRVADFGLVTMTPAGPPPALELHDRFGAALETSPGLLLGTPVFMAPEAMLGERVDARADQFSFCVALFHGLYDALPYRGDTLGERLEQITRGALQRPGRTDVPVPLQRLIERGLQARPDDRHPSMEALIASLEDALAHRPAPARTRAIDYGIERQRHDGFVGRGALLARLDQLLITEPVDRWVVVTGGPGMGKSAILAEWLARRESCGGWVPHHFIRRGEYDWDDATKLVSSLVAQLVQHYPDQEDPAADTQRHPAAQLAAMLTRVSVHELAPRGERLVVLIDGLDEYDPPAGASVGDPLAAFLPHALPRGVSILCASRVRHPYLAMLEARDGDLVRIDLDDATYAADNDATVRTLWERAAPQLELGAAFVDEAVARAGGNPQHAVTLRKHLAGLPAERRGMTGIPRGLAALLAKLWERIATDPVVVQGLGILCAAHEPLTLDEIGAVAGWHDDEARAAFLRGARELLVETCRASAEAEYRLHHDSIRAHVAATLGPAAVRAHHAALAHRLATWPIAANASSHRYALRHALAHRAEAGLWHGAWQLAADMGFLEARCRELGVREAEADVARTAERCLAAGDEAIARRFDHLARAVERESHWLRDAPEAAAALVWNRLRRSGWSADEIRAELRVPAARTFLRVRHGATRESLALVRNLAGHTRGVNACAVTPDGKRAISASEDRTLRIWDLDSGYALAVLDGHAGRVASCCVTSDGLRAVSASSDHTLRVWDLDSARTVRTLRGHTDFVTACAVTPDDLRVVSASEDGTLKLWDLDSGRLLATLRGHTGWVSACAVTHDGRRAISASHDRTLKVWDLDGGRALVTLSGHAGWVTACTVTPDGRHAISASEDRTLKVWDLEDGRLLANLEGHASWVTACAVTRDGRRVVSASLDRTLKVWDLEDSRLLANLQGHASWVTACAVTPDGRRVLSGSEDDMLKLWDLEGSELTAFEGHNGWVTRCAATPDGRRVLTASEDHTLKLWDVERGRVVAVFEGHAGWVTACAVTPDGRRAISVSDDHTMKVWELDTGHLLATLEGHAAWVVTCCVTPDGRHAISGSSDRTLKVWDLDAGRLVTTLAGHTDKLCACAVAPDGRRLASASVDRTLRLWDLERAELLATLESHGDTVHACAFTPDGNHLLSASFDRTLKVWDANSGRLLATLEGHGDSIYACAVTPDGRRVISASHDRTLKIWDLETRACVLTHRGDAPYTAVAATETAIVAGDEAGTVWFLDWPRSEP